MTNLSNQPLNDNTDFAAGDVVVLTGACRNFHSDDLFEFQRKFTNTLRVIKSKNHKLLVSDNEIRHATTAEKIAKRLLPTPVTILDMGEVNTISCHVSPLCQVLNKSYMTDVIDHLVRAHKAQREVS